MDECNCPEHATELKNMKRLLFLAAAVLYTDESGPPRDGLPGQGTTRYWIYEYLLNKDLKMPQEMIQI